jgi:hypothetical protein
MKVNELNYTYKYAVILITVWIKNIRQLAICRMRFILVFQLVAATHFYFLLCLSKIKRRYFHQTIQLRLLGL